jgi:hypothetical protein
MMKWLLITLLLPVVAFAQADPFEGLSDKQKAEIMVQIAEAKEAEKFSVDDLSDPDKIDRWVALGENMGKAAAGAAREVGMAADEFSRTGLGKIIIVLVAWKVMGDDAMTITGDIIDILVLGPLMIISLFIAWFFNRMLFMECEVVGEGDKAKKVWNTTNYRDCSGHCVYWIFFGVAWLAMTCKMVA